MNNTYQSSDLLIDLDGYEGPLDVLLALARKHSTKTIKIIGKEKTNKNLFSKSKRNEPNT